MKKSILSFLFLLISFCAFSQGGWLRPNNSFGTIQNRGAFDSILHMPTGCGAPVKLASRFDYLHRGALYLDSCNGIFYYYNPKDSSWNPTASGTIIVNDTATGLLYITWSGYSMCQHFADSSIVCHDLNTVVDDIRYNDDSTLMCLYNNGVLLKCLSTLKEVVVFHGNVAVNKINDTTHVYINGLTNGLISADVALVDSTVTVSNIYFRRNDTIYTLLGSNSFIINSASPGYYRTDIIWVDSTNTIRHTVGTEDTIATIAPSIDYNGIRITTVDVFGSVITTPSVSVTSDGWLMKGNNILPAGDSTLGPLTPKGMDIITNGVKRIGITRDGKIIVPSLQTVTDTTANKPAVMDVSTGQLKKLSYWPAGGATSPFDSTYIYALANSKQNQLNGTGFVKVTGTTISYDNTTYQPAGTYLTPTDSTFLHGKIITSFAKNTTKDSIILTLNDGTRYAVKDSLGAGGVANLSIGRGLDTTAAGALYADSSIVAYRNWVITQLALKLNITDTAFIHNKLVASFAKNTTMDSIILTLNDGTRIAVKDSIGSGGGSSALSGLTAATATNDINNLNYKQTWRWPTLLADSGVVIQSYNTNAGTYTGKSLFNVRLGGSSSTPTNHSTAMTVINELQGTGALYSDTALAVRAFGNGNNIAGSFTANGGTATALIATAPNSSGNNYAAVFPAGFVGIGTYTPTSQFDMLITGSTGFQVRNSTVTSSIYLDANYSGFGNTSNHGTGFFYKQ